MYLFCKSIHTKYRWCVCPFIYTNISENGGKKLETILPIFWVLKKSSQVFILNGTHFPFYMLKEKDYGMRNIFFLNITYTHIHFQMSYSSVLFIGNLFLVGKFGIIRNNFYYLFWTFSDPKIHPFYRYCVKQENCNRFISVLVEDLCQMPFPVLNINFIIIAYTPVILEGDMQVNATSFLTWVKVKGKHRWIIHFCIICAFVKRLPWLIYDFP